MFFNKTLSETEIKSLYSCANLNCTDNSTTGALWSAWTDLQNQTGVNTFSYDSNADLINVGFVPITDANSWWTTIMNLVPSNYNITTWYIFSGCDVPSESDWVIDGVWCYLTNQVESINGYILKLINGGNLTMTNSNLTASQAEIGDGSCIYMENKTIC